MPQLSTKYIFSKSRYWLTISTPQSVWHARFQRVYIAWLSFSKNPIAMTGLYIILSLLILAMFAPLITSGDGTSQELQNRLLAPSANHWLGTDELGRDIFDRIVWILIFLGGLLEDLFWVLGAIVGGFGESF